MSATCRILSGTCRGVVFSRIFFFNLEEALTDKIKKRIKENTTPRHVPAKVIQVTDIPRTKNGKVVELAVRSVVNGMQVGNTDALSNPEALELFRDLPELAA